jgi:hypothetical protein
MDFQISGESRSDIVSALLGIRKTCMPEGADEELVFDSMFEFCVALVPLLRK